MNPIRDLVILSGLAIALWLVIAVSDTVSHLRRHRRLRQVQRDMALFKDKHQAARARELAGITRQARRKG